MRRGAGPEADPADRAGPLATVVEQDSLVWVWIGDHDRADTRWSRGRPWLDADDYTTVRGMEPLKARYGLLVDNLLDLSHETYLHGGYIGTPRSPRRRSPPRWTRTEVVYVSRHMADAECPPFYARSTGIEGRITRWQDIEYHPPCLYLLHSRIAPVGVLPPEDGPDDQAFHVEVVYAITPETEHSTHDFWMVARDFALDDEEVTGFLRREQPDRRAAGRVALDVLEGVVEGEKDSYQELSINIDTGGLAARRMLKKLIEQGEAPAAPAGRATAPAAMRRRPRPVPTAEPGGDRGAGDSPRRPRCSAAGASTGRVEAQHRRAGGLLLVRRSARGRPDRDVGLAARPTPTPTPTPLRHPARHPDRATGGVRGPPTEIELRPARRARRRSASGVVSLELAARTAPTCPRGSRARTSTCACPATWSGSTPCAATRPTATAGGSAVLREPEGRGGSAYVHDKLAVGDRVAVRGPAQQLPARAGAAYVFIAGGIGITPLLPMIAAAEAAGADWSLDYGGRNRAPWPSPRSWRALRRPRPAAPAGRGGSARPRRHPRPPRPDALGLLLRAGAAARRRRAALCRRGRRRAARRAVRAGDGRRAGPDASFEVELAESGMTLTVPPDQSILRCSRRPGSACCPPAGRAPAAPARPAVLEGEVDHRDSLLTDEERAANDVMFVCVSRASCPKLVLQL